MSKTSLTLKFNALASLGTALVQPRYTTIRRRIGTRDGKNRSKREEPSGLIDRRGRDVLKDGHRSRRIETDRNGRTTRSRVTSTYVWQLRPVYRMGRLRRLTSNAGHSHAALWANWRWAAEAECNMPVATVDHVCGDGYAGGCESSSGNLAECRADGDAALSDR